MKKERDEKFNEEKDEKEEMKNDEARKEEYEAWEQQKQEEDWPLREAISIIKAESLPYVLKETDQFTGEIRVGQSLDMTEDFFAVAFVFEFSKDYW